MFDYQCLNNIIKIYVYCNHLEFEQDLFLYKYILYKIIATKNRSVPKYNLSPDLKSIFKYKKSANALYINEILFLNLGAKSCISDNAINPLM